ncbi:MAG TPA: hypothetical protein VLZ84_01025 [Asticcacaulis sp.]|nr:hypothetical protein [Asticcacaulis sp.]
MPFDTCRPEINKRARNMFLDRLWVKVERAADIVATLPLKATAQENVTAQGWHPGQNRLHGLEFFTPFGHPIGQRLGAGQIFGGIKRIRGPRLPVVKANQIAGDPQRQGMKADDDIVLLILDRFQDGLLGDILSQFHMAQT